ncbi:hypothetical protein H0A71_17100 [Alcaligenaceae bacterium]|nr:hypothetical protein [Alcaligenaceae bacterium]
MKFKHFLSWVIALASCSLVAGCSTSDSSDSATSDDQYSSRIHVIASKTGRIAPAQPGSTDSWILTLDNPEPTALWYTDRPSQEVGSTPLEDYINAASWRSDYGEVNPNATVLFQRTGSDELDGLYVSLSKPSYNEKSKTITFDAKILNDTFDQMSADTLAFTNVTINVLNNAVDDKSVSSYIQYASQAVLQPTAVSDQYKVVMSDAGPDMIWVDNAPGQYSDSRPMSYFFPQWPYVFKDSPPNAALFGTTATGKLKLYFLTLTDPVYDEASNQVSYTAKLLGQTSGALEIINQAVLSIDSGAFSRFPVPGKGTGYQAFGQGYDPSTANKTYIYFGSDIARKQTGSLWGTQSYLSQSCEPYCRDDIKTMKSLGINLIRLYDWDPRNDHSQFLDYADSLNIKVVVPISNWLPTQSPSVWNEQVPSYFKPGNFSNKNGTDWHPAVAGVIISNELDRENGGQYYGNVIGLVARFIQEADKRGFSKNVPVGVPVTFVPQGAPFGPGGQNMPSWKQFNQLLTDPRTAPYKDRLMLCPNTYNSKEYLFENAESTGQGWVQLTYKQFGVPILFTEIGLSRAESYFTPAFVRDQLQGALAYQKANPQQILGAMHFQFDDKVWKQTPNDTDTEGAYGMYHHGAIVKQLQTVASDFNFQVGEATDGYGVLTIDKLDPTRTYAPVVEAYK